MTSGRVQDATGTGAQVEAGWRERALAAEAALEAHRDHGGTTT